MSETPRHPDEDSDATVRLPRPDRSTPPVSRAADAGTPDRSSSTAGPSADSVPAADSAPDSGSDSGSATDGGAAGGGARGVRSVAGGLGAGWRRLVGSVGTSERRGPRPTPGAAGTPEERQRRRRQWWVAGISAGSALVVIALCAGALWVVDIVDDDEGDTAARESQALRDQSCLDLERRLNRLNPPGATTNPATRAVAIRDENAAVRLYVGEINDQRAQDGWRQLLDARGVFADALDRQAKTRTPAFYVVPRADDREPVTADLLEWSPSACAGPLRRLAAPDL